MTGYSATAGDPRPLFISSYSDFAPLNPGYDLTFVIAGLDPAIHAAKGLEDSSDWLRWFHLSMDRRIKSGGDEKPRASLFDM